MKNSGFKVIDEDEKIKQYLSDNNISETILLVLDSTDEGKFSRRRLLHDFRAIQKRLRKISKMINSDVDSKKIETTTLALEESADELETFISTFENILEGK